MLTLKEIEKKIEILLNNNQYFEIINYVETLNIVIQNLPKILYYKGLAFLRTNKFLEAKKFLEKALEEDPSSQNTAYNAGLANYFLQKYDKSISLLEQSLLLKKNDILSIIYLAKSLFEANQIKNSFKLLEQAIRVYPTNANFYFELSSNFFKIKNYTLAIKFYSKVAELQPDFNDVYLNLAICYLSINDHESAIHNLEIQKKKTPNNYLIYFNLGNIYREIGSLKLAEEFYLQAISKNTYHCESYRMMTALKKFKLDDDLVKKLKSAIIIHEKDSNIKSLISGYYALSKICEDNKDFEHSFNFFSKANKLRRAEVKYSEALIKEQFSMIKNLFNVDFVKKMQSHSSFLNNQAIFILGMPRSGTTLVEQIVSAHKDVVSGGELFIMQAIIKKYFPQNDYNLFYQDVCQKLSSLTSQIGKEYCDELNKIGPFKKVTDKLPFNFIFIGFIKCCLPNAKIIHCTRNAKDTCISILKNYFPLDDVGFAHTESEIVEYYQEYVSLMSHWKSIFKNDIFDLSYEQNILYPKKTLQDLLNYLELEWDDNCLNHHKTKNIIKTISTTQARMPIYNTSIDIWKNYEKFLSSDFILLK
jgi:Tfp pilus assembly protein PilF